MTAPLRLVTVRTDRMVIMIMLRRLLLLQSFRKEWTVSVNVAGVFADWFKVARPIKRAAFEMDIVLKPFEDSSDRNDAKFSKMPTPSYLENCERNREKI